MCSKSREHRTSAAAVFQESRIPEEASTDPSGVTRRGRPLNQECRSPPSEFRYALLQLQTQRRSPPTLVNSFERHCVQWHGLYARPVVTVCDILSS